MTRRPYLSSCATGTQLHLMCARAAARLGDQDTAITEITAAASDHDPAAPAQDLLEIGGQFGLSRACHRYLAGSAALELPAVRSEAINWLGQAIDLYAQGPGPGEDHSEHCQNIARIDLATALLTAGDLDAAVVTTAQVLALPPGRRISSLPKRLALMRAELAAPRYLLRQAGDAPNCRRASRPAPPARVVLARRQPAVPRQQRRGRDGEDAGPAPARYKPCQRGQPGPVSRLVPHPASMPPQYGVLTPEHQQLSILRQVTAEQQHGHAGHPAREQADDPEQHAAS